MLQSSPKLDVVNVSSIGHLYAAATGIAYAVHIHEDRYDPVMAYASSKLANIAFTQWLVKNFGIRAYCVHPGLVDTGLWTHTTNTSIGASIHAGLSKALMKTPTQGAEAVLAVVLGAVCSQQRTVTAVPGGFHADGICGPAADTATHPAVIAELVDRSQTAIGQWWQLKGHADCTPDVIAAVSPLLNTWRC